MTDSAGFTPNIFYSGTAKLVVTDGDDVQYIERDPVGGENELGNFSSWSALVTYDANDIVEGSDGRYYQSFSGGNLDNDPTLTPTAWFEVRFIEVWNTNKSYSIGDVVQTTDGSLWKSVIVSNAANDPAVDDGTSWLPAIDLSAATTLSGKNFLINGDFDIWQRGVSFANPNSVYTADRWLCDVIRGNTGDVTREEFVAGQTDVPHAQYYARFTATTAPTGSRALMRQRIEDVHTGADKTITVSFFANVLADETINVDFSYDFGVGGSAGFIAASLNVALTVGWKKYTVTVVLPSISGSTVGTGSFWHVSFISFSTAATSTVEFARVQAEEGTFATEFEYRPIAEELALCQRYFERISTLTGITNIAVGQCFSAVASRIIVPFITSKRTRAYSVGATGAGTFALTTSVGSLQACNSFTLDSFTEYNIRVLAGTASGMSAGNATILRALNATEAYIDIDAEL